MSSSSSFDLSSPRATRSGRACRCARLTPTKVSWAARCLICTEAIYLATFGKRDVVLQTADDADARLAALRAFYQEHCEEVPLETVMIGVNGASGDRGLRGEEVVVSRNGAVLHVSAMSFKNHLYRQAFVHGRFVAGARLTMRRNDETSLTKIIAALEQCGFRLYAFSDSVQAS